MLQPRDVKQAVISITGEDNDQDEDGLSKIKLRPTIGERQCSDLSSIASFTADEETLLPSWTAPSLLLIGFYYVLFIVNPFSFAADDLFASFNSGIVEYFDVDDEKAQQLSYHWDSISNAVATIGAPLSAFICSIVNPTYVSVFGSCLTCCGIGLVLTGFASGSYTNILGGIGIRSIGSEIQIQALFPIIKHWTTTLNLSEGASLIYMERAVALVNASVLLIVAFGPMLALSNSLTVISQGLSICFGLCGLSTMTLAICLYHKSSRRPNVSQEKCVARGNWGEIMSSKVSQVKAIFKHILLHPRAVLALLERNIILVLQDQSGKGYATVVLPLSTVRGDKEYLGKLILIVPAFCTMIVTMAYTFTGHHSSKFDRTTKRFNSLLLSLCMLYTCTIWHFLSRAEEPAVIIVLIVLIGLGRGIASCLISHPVGAAYDQTAELVNPSNFMPLMSNIMQNCIFSFTPWFMPVVTASSSPDNQLAVYRNAPFWGYIGISIVFILQGLIPYPFTKRRLGM